MRSNRERAKFGTILIAAAIAFAVLGIILSVARKEPVVFRILSLPVSLFLVSGGVLLGRSMTVKDGKLQVRPEALPRDLTATVLGITRGLSLQSPQPEAPQQYYVICKYKDPGTGEEYTFTSEALDAYPGKEIIGKQVPVHVNSYENGDYQIDLRSLSGLIQ